MRGKTLTLREVKSPARDQRASAYWQWNADPGLPDLPLPPSCLCNQHICAAVTGAPPETVNLTNLWSCSGSHDGFLYKIQCQTVRYAPSHTKYDETNTQPQATTSPTVARDQRKGNTVRQQKTRVQNVLTHRLKATRTFTTYAELVMVVLILTRTHCMTLGKSLPFSGRLGVNLLFETWVIHHELRAEPWGGHL